MAIYPRGGIWWCEFWFAAIFINQAKANPKLSRESLNRIVAERSNVQLVKS